MENSFDEIVDYLFVGNYKTLELQKFDMIVNCTKNIYFPTHYNVMCIRISVNDSPDECNKLLYEINNTLVLEHMNYYIRNKRSVLVHCSMGIQRSCALVACYLIKYYGWTPTEAIEYIKTKRPIAFFGNINFLETIENFHHNLREYDHSMYKR